MKHLDFLVFIFACTGVDGRGSLRTVWYRFRFWIVRPTSTVVCHDPRLSPW